MSSGSWNTGRRPVTEGMYRYLVVIRAPEDPKRRPRPVGGQEDRTPHRTIAAMDIEEIKSIVRSHMADGAARTLNRIGTELWDKTADITFGTKLEEALWLLVEARELEHTMEAPVLFRTADRR